MARKPRVLIATLGVVIAVGAMATTSAQASVFMTEGNVAATLTGEQVEGEGVVFSAGTEENRVEIKCKTAKFTTKLATSPVEELIVAPEYSGCEIALQAVDVNMTGCTYRYRSVTTTEKDTFHSPVDLVCPVGKQIDTTFTALGQSVRTLTVLPKKNLEKAEITDMTNNPRTLTLKLQLLSVFNLRFDEVVPGGCLSETPEVEMEDGSLTGNTTVTATNEGGKAIGLTAE